MITQNSKLKTKDGIGKLVIVSGPSGVGKSTICKEVIKQLKNAHLSISVTTRPKSENEVDGRDYWFISKEQFQQRVNEGLLLEHAEVFGNFYGTPKDKVADALRAGETIILEIDVQGAKQIKAKYPAAVMIFVLPPTPKKLAERMNNRGREDVQTAEKRLNGAGIEIAAAWQYYEHMVINDDLEQAVKEIVQIIKQSIGEKE
ncbi:MAG: guanylate kinase [Phycisphaerae bacterium]|nr:guanylate kinase [Phycisphaerae bacterium]MDD5380492.1 guanylate kinase [Phycisphaerae bacterium]